MRMHVVSLAVYTPYIVLAHYELIPEFVK